MKNVLKKLFAAMLAATLGLGVLFGFAACGSDDTIVVYTEAGFAPFEYISGGKIVGVDVDIMNKVGKKLGKKVEFENVKFDTIVDTVSKGKLCKVGAAGISVTDERKAKVDFSNEYYTAKLYVIYKKTAASTYESETTDGVTGVYWNSLRGKTIAVQSGTTADLFMSDELEGEGALAGSNAKPSRFDELAAAVEDVSGSQADVLIIDELPAQKLISKDSTLNCAPLYYKGDGTDGDEAAQDVYAICVTKGEKKLLDAINEVLDELGKDGIEELVQKHLGVK